MLDLYARIHCFLTSLSLLIVPQHSVSTGVLLKLHCALREGTIQSERDLWKLSSPTLDIHSSNIHSVHILI